VIVNRRPAGIAHRTVAEPVAGRISTARNQASSSTEMPLPAIA